MPKSRGNSRTESSLVVVVDLNVLIYATNADAPQHAKALAWWESLLNGDEQVGLTWPVLIGFLRLTTRTAIVPNPLTIKQAIAIIDAWLSHPLVIVINPGSDHWRALKELLGETGTAGNLTTDAHLAAVALEYGATLATTDRDFSRYRRLKTLNPIDV